MIRGERAPERDFISHRIGAGLRRFSDDRGIGEYRQWTVASTARFCIALAARPDHLVLTRTGDIMTHSFRLITFTAFALLGSIAGAQTLEIAGSTSVQKAILEPSAGKAREATGLEVKVLPVGSGKGMVMLAEGKVKVAAISDSLDDAVSSAKKAGMANTPAGLKMHTILTEKLVPIVHPDNPVKTLTQDQLKGLLGGKIVNWKDVGGADLPVVVVTGAPGSGTRAVIEKQVLGGGAFGPNAKELRATSAELAEVARDKGAIGYVGDGLAETAKGKVSEVKGPEVSRPLALVTVGEPSAEVKKLIDFLQTPDAKKLFVQ